ncbi:Leukemia inhibitory factor receptor, partial [Bienertia sinuspersici]
MRKLCPNLDKEDALETILEVPIPEEMFNNMGNNVTLRCQNMQQWMKAQTSDKWSSPVLLGRVNELRFILHHVGSPLIPLQIHIDKIGRPVKDSSIQTSTAKYIVQQYIAATGGQTAISSIQSMCVIGHAKIEATAFHLGDQAAKGKNTEEAGGFVVWQKNPNLWCLEFVVSGCKVYSGSNGKLSWRQSTNQSSGLDPRATANLFIDAVCIGEKVINNEDCFILKLETSQATLDAQCEPHYEIIHHTLWGYFSQRSGLLLQFGDSRMLCLKNDVENDSGDGVFWEISAESLIEDYRYVDGVNIAHSGKTSVRVFRYGEQSANHQREIEETWNIDEVGFNIWGLDSDFFMPPKKFE